jgi:hypothetical protein
VKVSRFRRIVLVLATAATGGGIAGLHAQTALVDPKDSRQIFATTCSACHKSPQGLAKSGQVAGFLRQHYTTGPEMSAAMAAYLVAAGSAPASKKGEKGAASAENAKAKSKKQELATVQPGADPAADAKDRTLRGKQRGKQHDAKQQDAKQHETKQPDEPPAARPSPLPPVTPVAPDGIRQAAVPAAPGTASTDVPAPAATPPEPAQPPAPPLVTFDIPVPPMPDAPPADLTQSVFSSSPVP